MKLIFRYVLFLILQAALSSSPAQSASLPTRDYLGGMNALSQNDIKTAEKLFQKSVRENDDASSLFQLAKIYAAKNTPEGRRYARIVYGGNSSIYDKGYFRALRWVLEE